MRCLTLVSFLMMLMSCKPVEQREVQIPRNITATVLMGTPRTIALVGSAPIQNSQTFTVIENVLAGRFVVDNFKKTGRYIPISNFIGEDRLVYKVMAGDNEIETVTVKFHVIGSYGLSGCTGGNGTFSFLVETPIDPTENYKLSIIPENVTNPGEKAAVAIINAQTLVPKIIVQSVDLYSFNEIYYGLLTDEDARAYNIIAIARPESLNDFLKSGSLSMGTFCTLDYAP